MRVEFISKRDFKCFDEDLGKDTVIGKIQPTPPTISTQAPAMENQLEMLEARALQLSISERAAFAQFLLSSLDEDAEVDAAWDIEAEHRMAEINRGAMQVVPLDQALAQVRSALS